MPLQANSSKAAGSDQFSRFSTNTLSVLLFKNERGRKKNQTNVSLLHPSKPTKSLVSNTNLKKNWQNILKWLFKKYIGKEI